MNNNELVRDSRNKQYLSEKEPDDDEYDEEEDSNDDDLEYDDELYEITPDK